MKTTSADEYAEVAYEAYKMSVGGKSIKGEPLPKYKDMPAGIQAAWMNAAAAVLEADNAGIAELAEETAKLFEKLARRFRATYKAFSKKEAKE
jgi:hypothetical protein